MGSPEPRAFLDLSTRCSSEELLDRLFKKSVVTEAEVTVLPKLSALHTHPTRPASSASDCLSQQTWPSSHSVPKLRELLGIQGPQGVSRFLSQSQSPPSSRLTTSPPSLHLLLRHDSCFAQAAPHTQTLPTFGPRGISGLGHSRVWEVVWDCPRPRGSGVVGGSREGREAEEEVEADSLA